MAGIGLGRGMWSTAVAAALLAVLDAAGPAALADVRAAPSAVEVAETNPQPRNLGYAPKSQSCPTTKQVGPYGNANSQSMQEMCRALGRRPEDCRGVTGRNIPMGPNFEKRPNPLPFEQPAYGQTSDTGTTNVPNVGEKPCVPRSDFMDVDTNVSTLPQTGRTNDDSFNCFYYARTYIEGARPFERPVGGSLNPLRSWQSPARATIDEAYLGLHNYRLVYSSPVLPTTKSSVPPEPGDIIMVPGSDPLGILAGQRYFHAGIVVGVGAASITRIRQKVDPFHCVVDLTPAEFQKVYQPEAGANYEIWRRAR